MEIRYQLQHADLVGLRQHLEQRLRTRKYGVIRRGGGVLLLVFLAAHFVLAANGSADPYQKWVWMLTGTLFLASLAWMVIWQRSGRSDRWLEQFAGSHALDLSPAGISSASPDGRVGFYAWTEVVALETTVAGLYFYLGRSAAFLVPRASFGEQEDADAFAREVRRLWLQHPENAGKVLYEVPGLPSLFPAGEIWANLRLAARVVSFREFDPAAFRVSHSMVLWLLLAELFAFGLADYVSAFPAAEFDSNGLTAFGAAQLFVFAGAAVISSRMTQRASMLRLLVMVIASSVVTNWVYLPVSVGVERALVGSPKILGALYAMAILWQLAAVFRIMRRLYRQPVPSALFLASIYAVFAFALAEALPQQRLYFAMEPDEPMASYAAASKFNVEDVYYRQPELVSRALEGMKAHHPGPANLYFVGFAGQADEEVFSNEVRVARDLLDRRFYTAGRSLLLLNNAGAVKDTPLASVHNLGAVLQGVAKRMDKQHDVLFLYLSSHGAADHRLSVSFRPLALDDLKAERLKEILDKSGIRNRVIVVSACYSGGFLDVLKDDNSLILTASSRDHVAYGCGDYTQYTFFGEAYFVKALGHGDSFISAFGEARGLIAEREKSEGMESSGPQIHVGRNIGKVLGRLKVIPAGESFKAQQCPDDCPGESG